MAEQWQGAPVYRLERRRVDMEITESLGVTLNSYL